MYTLPSGHAQKDDSVMLHRLSHMCLSIIYAPKCLFSKSYHKCIVVLQDQKQEQDKVQEQQQSTDNNSLQQHQPFPM